MLTRMKLRLGRLGRTFPLRALQVPEIALLLSRQGAAMLKWLRLGRTRVVAPTMTGSMATLVVVKFGLRLTRVTRRA